MLVEAAVQIDHLRKVYGKVAAVEDVSFSVQPGEVFGLLGPNGSGKTTTVECLVGLLKPDGGILRVLGLDPVSDGAQLRPRIGVQFQESSLPERLTVSEAVDLFASLYPKTVPWRPLLEQLGLSEKRNARIATLSGGQKQRLFIALALVHDPELVVLDELTTGLDPHARRAIWDLIADIRSRGRTIILTTHFMEEAERLCDHVAILDRGRVVAQGTPRELIARAGGAYRVMFTVPDGTLLDPLRQIPGVTRVETANELVTVYGEGEDLTTAVVNALSAHGIAFRELRAEQPTLEDVFLALTGR